jgi:hypothetical protein
VAPCNKKFSEMNGIVNAQFYMGAGSTHRKAMQIGVRPHPRGQFLANCGKKSAVEVY